MNGAVPGSESEMFRIFEQDGLTRATFLRLAGSGLLGAAVLGGTGCDGEGMGSANCARGILWENFPRTQSLTPISTCRPGSLEDLVATVNKAEADGKRLHAFGSKWAFSDCAVTTDYVLDTTRLTRDLQPIRDALRAGQPPEQELYHVEAGVSIRRLYERLDAAGLALETMGGASGQTLAGAVSTGTHGGDKFLPPLADSVVALHLVGAGGTEYWIEPRPGITDPDLLRKHIAAGIKRKQIIYDSDTFNACLVSLGAMGVIYAVVLKVRKPYDLVEETRQTTWKSFKATTFQLLSSRDHRFVQLLVNPYRSDDGDNLCLLTTRSEADVTGPNKRPDNSGALAAALLMMLAQMAAVFPGRVAHLQQELSTLVHDETKTTEQKIAQFVDAILRREPILRAFLVINYGSLLQAQFPPGTFRGSSFSVMDLGYGSPIPSSQPGWSLEMHFPGVDSNGGLGFSRYVDDVIEVVNTTADTYFAGYISLRFTGPTRAWLGMQQWNQTCSIEIATVQGVKNLEKLMVKLYRLGVQHGGLPHWGQLLDWGAQGSGHLYPKYSAWRGVYARMSRNFSKRTFENDLTRRWQLTTPT